ncbi:hypothetical protein ABK040_015481 [Willaertia magna]
MTETTKKQHKHEVNQAKVEQLKKISKDVKIAPGLRRKKKVVKQGSQTESKIRTIVNKWRLTTIPDVMEVSMLMDDNTIVTMQGPKVEAAVHSNSFVLTGKYQRMTYEEYFPTMLKQLSNNLDPNQLQQLLQGLQRGGEDKKGEEVPTEEEEKQDLPPVESFENVQ